MKLTANNKVLDLSTPQIMGILNFTPDSFSDSGKFFQLDKALAQVEKMLRLGASIIDIGGESTRPMADEVTLEEELQRVVPLVEAVRQRFDCWISVDTSKPQVMRETANAGMDLINDIRALQEPQALETAAQLALPVCIMHMQGQPRTMQLNPHYEDVVADVLKFMQQRTEQCLAAGIKQDNIIWDPGFGFGKSVQHNYRLLQQLWVFCQQGYPVLAGISRKSMIGAVLDKPVEQRTVGSVSAALIAAMNGARILRVHDVGETADALKIWQATLNS
ncbi:dihydropteroate synthase [Aggregatibacter actinomycetemcomitans]|uniref:dihydropteroate synthase n=2 Tax=Aggregatibacter actinomycetemcomitans TaxID=714 RepID=UPI00022AC832|nr:dihydropteroate synthase [Aggregatibacter actinomycetemcomitans]AEW77234.1 dihydropteroate synthase [Aggregatibacter actinomycetemcomitans ANH9381]AMQ91404.1 dihydropteroate synthase [Aggregatibacter actinomycetemcomitans]KND82379.1 dihydropteroate synthase [Aggregatibacter actinomycetemcomitans serotype b str. SCC1398]KOE54569.1 dihydropteroate synthase [Aggregatibacter actinomycetemcomitans serotype b str. SCC4092]KOE55429.1 dihydropteroate synthase [Aggregatibacter actinomycetemcomitans 